MNKLAIPTILVATVMVAGLFAFVPVQQASTVHLSDDFQESVASAAGQVRVEVTGINESTGLSGYVTFDRIAGEGVFSVEGLYICDLEVSNENFRSLFEFQTETSLATGTGGKLLGVMGHEMLSALSGDSNDGFDQGCFNILNQATYEYESGLSGTLNQQKIFLAGDEDNDIRVFMRHDSGSMAGSDGDGAVMVAYISGASASDIEAIETEP